MEEWVFTKDLIYQAFQTGIEKLLKHFKQQTMAYSTDLKPIISFLDLQFKKKIIFPLNRISLKIPLEMFLFACLH